MDVDFTRVRSAELIALVGGLLLGVAMFLPWFAFPSGNLDAWSSFTVIEVPLALTAAAGIALFWVTLTRASPAIPVATGVWSSLIGLIGTLCVVLRLLKLPSGSFDTCFGAWLGLGGAVLVLVGAWAGVNDERPFRGSSPTGATGR
jgi:hypothetical protein